MKIKVKIRDFKGRTPPYLLKEGILITVLKEPEYWSSAASNMNPKYGIIEFPFTGRLNKLVDYRGEHWAADVGGYGFDMNVADYIVI